MTQQTPIPMILHCPACRFQHVDAAEPVTEMPPMAYAIGLCASAAKPAWDNPPHRTHLCKACGHLWKPANVPTTGVKELPAERGLSRVALPGHEDRNPVRYTGSAAHLAPGARIRHAVTGEDLGPAD